MVYLSRYNYKHDEEERLKELQKACWFLDKLIEFKQNINEVKNNG